MSSGSDRMIGSPCARRKRPVLLDRAVTTAACLAVAYVCMPAAPASAQTLSSGSAAETCLAANRDLSLGASLPHTAARFREGGPLKIVAIGSSSTTGLWVLNSAATFPEVMRRELEKLRPSSRIEIVNSGRIGETIKDNLARFERDVLAHRPDLVIWQIGTNDVAWGGHADGLKDQVIRGVRALKTAGVDVIDGPAIRADRPRFLAARAHAGCDRRNRAARTGRPVSPLRSHAPLGRSGPAATCADRI